MADHDAGREGRQWAVVAAQAADAKQAHDIVVLDVGDVLAITECFLIASAPNTRLVRTIAEAIEEALRDAGGPKPLRTEGLGDLHWVLLDFGDLVAHIFLQETRDYYELERLWGDVPKVNWTEGAA